MKYYVGQKIRLKRNIGDTDNWIVSPALERLARSRTVLNVTKVEEFSYGLAVKAKEVNLNTWIDVEWIDDTYNSNHFEEDLFTL